MLNVALTGGIGCGKSTVCNAFADLGVPIIDTDLLARELVAPNQPALHELVEHFGNDILTVDGHLNRTQLANIVFNDSTQRKTLEAILHPRIRKRVETLKRQLKTAYCIVVIPLLFETQQQDQYDHVIVVDCDVSQQIARTHARDGRSEDEIRKIIATQVSRDERRSLADSIIDNNQKESQLKQQVLKLHQHLLELADNQ